MQNLALADQEEQLDSKAMAQFADVYRQLLSHEKGSLQGREEWLESQMREVARLMLQEWMDEQGPGELEQGYVETADGRRLTHRRRSARKVTTIFGDIRVQRMGYGGRGARSVYPLEQTCALASKKHSYALQKRSCREAVLHCFDDAIDSVETYLGVSIPKRQLLSLVREVAPSVDPFYEQQPQAPCSSGNIIVTTMDGKGLVMRSEDLRQETRRKQEKLEYKQRHRLSKGEKPYRKRIATVAAVYELEQKPRGVADVVAEFAGKEAQKRPRAEAKRVWANVKDEVRVVADQVVAEAERRLGEQSHVVFISDGDHRMRQPMLAALRDSTSSDLDPSKVTFIVDIVHALERLWSAAFGLFGEGSDEVEPWVDKQMIALLQGKAVQVAATMRRTATRLRLSGHRRKKVDRAAAYLRKYKHDMRYDEYLRLGFPIASGVVEGACKHVVKDRCERSGARWSLLGADALLKLRSVWLSGDWDAFWRFHVDQDQARRWSDVVLPTLAPSTPSLRLIKGGKPSC